MYSSCLFFSHCRVWLLSGLCICFWNCSSPSTTETQSTESNQQAVADTSQNPYQQEVIRLREERIKDSVYIVELTQEMEAIYAKIEAMQNMEKKVRSTSSDLTQGQVSVEEGKNKIQANMDAIFQELAESKSRTEQLEKKLKSANKNNSGLQTMVERLKRTVEAENNTIILLSKELEVLQEKVKTLKLALDMKKATVNAQDEIIGIQKEKINTGYYVLGTEKDLKKRGIIISDTKGLAPERDEMNFTQINIEKQTSFSLGQGLKAKKIKLVPVRPANTYKLEEENGGLTLVVTDAKRFWKDKYLAIITD
ncbi:MAG: hypothetical protein EAZ57_05980 [Cytophagales bacterium]|nr:MAG: hypothetical protein EAZ67_08170 [Cytophagales bacterium]TAF60732.1 MAG: hypothetical protein EAZ57_05980 [Cytophagales bacterium]